jgi:hypothetical protein
MTSQLDREITEAILDRLDAMAEPELWTMDDVRAGRWEKIARIMGLDPFGSLARNLPPSDRDLM